MEGDDRVGAEETSVPQAAHVLELREKLQMAQEELQLVQADLTMQLEQAQQTAAEERAGPAEQLRQAQRMSEAAKEEGEEQRCKAQEAERQLDGLARENKELRQQLQESEEGTKTEVDTIRLRLELKGLWQLEEVQKQFDVERDWYREQARSLAGEVAEARDRLEDHERPSYSTVSCTSLTRV